MPPPTSAPTEAQAPTALADPPCAQYDGDLSPAVDGFCRALRNTLGSFATGVTVVSTCNAGGQPTGITINSFSSVSLDPPLILWSLSNGSPSLDTFLRAQHYAVNILAEEQEWLSNHFAARTENPFSPVEVTSGLGGIPLLTGCLAWFECTHEAHYPGGDHLVFVGRILRFTQGKMANPLIFHGGRYRRLVGD